MIKATGSRILNRVTVFVGLAAVLLLGTPGLYPPAAMAKDFKDLKNQPAEIQEAVDHVTDRGYMSGSTDGRFRPTEPVTRLEYASAVVKLFKKQKEQIDPGISFKDLESGEPGFKYANIAVKQGYLTPFDDGTFRPDRDMTTVACLAGLNTGLGLDGPESPVANAQGIWPEGPSYSGHSIISSTTALVYWSALY